MLVHAGWKCGFSFCNADFVISHFFDPIPITKAELHVPGEFILPSTLKRIKCWSQGQLLRFGQEYRENACDFLAALLHEEGKPQEAEMATCPAGYPGVDGWNPAKQLSLVVSLILSCNPKGEEKNHNQHVKDNNE